MRNGNTTPELKRALRDAARGGEEAAARAADRAARHAAEEGLAAVAYATADTPLGPMLVAATRRGLVRVAFPHESPDDVLGELAVRISPRILEAPTQLDEVRRELEQYFERERREFDLPLDWRLSRGFRRRVLRHTARVPYGETATYAEMAARAGSPYAYRAAGSALGSNPTPLVVPCHRVLSTGGGLGGYGGGVDVKEYLLHLEGAL
jgi:methylated-DNA-[protein]-cysteine S-methyltransferase